MKVWQKSKILLSHFLFCKVHKVEPSVLVVCKVFNGINISTGKMADWDYIIEVINSREWSKIKNSLPGARSVLDNMPRNIDLLKGPVDLTKPYITIKPR